MREARPPQRSALPATRERLEVLVQLRVPTRLARPERGGADASRLLKLIDALEESDDVGAVHANFDVDAEVLERIAG